MKKHGVLNITYLDIKIILEKIINLEDGMAHMKVCGCEVWVPENYFKPRELSWLYNKIFTLSVKNPHTYENENLRIEKGDYVIDAGAC